MTLSAKCFHQSLAMKVSKNAEIIHLQQSSVRSLWALKEPHCPELAVGGFNGDGLSSKPGEHNLFSPHPGARGCRDYSHLRINVPKTQEGQLVLFIYEGQV